MLKPHKEILEEFEEEFKSYETDYQRGILGTFGKNRKTIRQYVKSVLKQRDEEWKKMIEEIEASIRKETIEDILKLPSRAVSFMRDGIYLQQVEEYALSKGIELK